MVRAFAELSFTPSVRAQQRKMGSAGSYANLLEEGVPPGNCLGDAETAFLSGRVGFYQASVAETGWPYVQFRGGPKGFLRVLDPQTIAYADFRGNRQYLSVGNLTADNRVMLFVMDYVNRRRLKIWGRARLIDAADDPALIEQITIADYRATVERAVIITVEALDWNCPQHIPQLVPLAEFQSHVQTLQQQLKTSLAENRRLRSLSES